MTFTRRSFPLHLAAAATAAAVAPPTLPDIRTVQPDLTVPEFAADARPAAGRRVRGTLLPGTDVYHALYLPADWKPRRRYPVIVEYAGNGNYRNQYGDESRGVPEGSSLGYGITAGRGAIWLCLPYVDPGAGRNAITWWGDAGATVDYCLRAVDWITSEWGGDRRRLFLAGFSRGAIACNYIGLRSDAIARLWRGFICYSQYDGVRAWPYADSDRASARERLTRLRGRPQFICDEVSVAATREYLQSTGAQGRFTLRDLPFRNHNDTWVLRPVPLRTELRRWFAKA
ncbi:MAG: hypothetical protein IT162_16910 [Bryobacterales bacterium]|nr:hypothetical protein [Bryobacterales bacterium]